MATTTLMSRDFLETILLNFDHTLDVSEGSPLDQYVITPILDRVEADPLAVDFEELAASMLRTRFPELDVNDGSAIYDLVVKPMAILLEPIYQALRLIADNQSLENWQKMSEKEVDALLANFFYSRPAQNYATGKVRIYYNQPVDVDVGQGVVFYTSSGLRFVPQSPQRATAAQMALNKEGALYYVDVLIVAESPGDEYNVSPGEINRITGLSQAVRVFNHESVEGGTRRVDNLDAIEQARDLISGRSLVTYGGIVSVVSELVPGLRAVQAVGYGDPEMLRDVIVGGSAGEIIGWGSDGLFVDDNLSDGKTSLVYAPTADFVDLVGSGVKDDLVLTINGVDTDVVKVIDGQHLQVEDRQTSEGGRSDVLSGTDLQSFAGNPWVYSASTDFTATGVVPGHALYINDATIGGWYRVVEVGYGTDSHHDHRLLLDRAPSASVSGTWFRVPFGHQWYLRRKVLKYTDNAEGELHQDSAPGGVHIGGKADVYVASDLQEENVAMESVSDTRPAVRGYSLATYYNPGAVLTKVIDSGVDMSGVDVGDVLHIYTGSAAGIYTVIGRDPSRNDVLSIYPPVSAPFSGAAYRISDEIDVELTSPRDVLFVGNDLQTSAGLRSAVSALGVDFAGLGVVAGDVLEITTGDDVGEYGITGVSGTSNNILVLDRGTSFSASGVGYRVFRQLNQVQPPVVEVSRVEYRDSNGVIRGTVPRGEVLGAWVSGGMSNPLHGDIPLDVTGWNYDQELYAISGIVSRELDSLTPATLDLQTLVFELDGSPITVTFSSPSDWENVVEQIHQHSGLRGLARIQQWHGKNYLVIGRTDKSLLKLTGGTATSILNFYNQDSSSSEVRSDVVSVHTAKTYNTVDPYLSFRDVDVWRVRLRLVTEWETYNAWVYELTDFVSANNAGAVAFVPGSDTIEHCPAGIYPVQVGYASVGTVRFHFQDPTLCRVQAPLPKTAIAGDGWDVEPTVILDEVGRKFFPDMMFSSDIIPSEPGKALKNNGSMLMGTFSTKDSGSGVYPDRDSTLDFRQWGIKVGDLLNIESRPIEGSVDLSTFPSTSGLALRLALDGSVRSVDLDSVTTSTELKDAINNQVGQQVAVIYNNGGVEHLVLESDSSLVVLSDGSPTDAAPVVLGSGYDGSTTSYKSQWRIIGISDDGSSIYTNAPFADDNLHFSVIRPGTQMTTAVAANAENFGFYYFDIEIVSDGFGDTWNLEDGAMMQVFGDETWGWRLESEKPELTFSSREKLWMVLSPKFIDEGAESEPSNWIDVAGLNLVVYYTTSRAVEEVQAVIDDPQYRVVTADLLAKHLRPVRVYLNLSYSSGPDAERAEKEITDLIETTPPATAFSVQQVAEVLHRLSATAVSHPIELVALVWDDNRRVRLIHSHDRILEGQRSILYRGQVEVVRQ